MGGLLHSKTVNSDSLVKTMSVTRMTSLHDCSIIIGLKTFAGTILEEDMEYDD